MSLASLAWSVVKGYSFTLFFVLSYLTSARPTCETISDGIFGIKIRAAMSD